LGNAQVYDGGCPCCFSKKNYFGLEFVIAADIMLAAVTVDLSEIYQLGGIVLIRVLLGYSLRKEITSS